MIPKTELDYVAFYAKQLKKNNKYFEQQKMLIESQLQGSRQLFRNRFGTGEEFKRNARMYLRTIGILQ